MATCPVVRIASAEHAEYGGFVEINESDFDPKKHTLFEAEEPEGAKLSVAEIREAMTAKGIDIPEGAKKAELRALLDAA